MSLPLDQIGSFERPLSAALGLAHRAADWVSQSGRALVASSVCSGPAVVLGALQRESSVRDSSSELEDRPAVRRATTGTAAWAGETVLHHVVALPAISTLVADAQPGNFINRHVRGLLAGYRGVGVPAHYFGREVFTLSRRPAGVIGVDVLPSGVWLLEALVGVDQPAPLSGFRGAEPIGLRASLRESGAARALDDPVALAARIHERLLASWSGKTPGAVETLELSQLPTVDVTPVAHVEGLTWRRREVPIGLLELARAGESYHLRGDILSSQHGIRQLEAALSRSSPESAMAALDGFPLDGARSSDLLELISQR